MFCLERFESCWGGILMVGNQEFHGRALGMFVGKFGWAGIFFCTKRESRSVTLRDLLCCTGFTWRIRIKWFWQAWRDVVVLPLRWLKG